MDESDEEDDVAFTVSKRSVIPFPQPTLFYYKFQIINIQNNKILYSFVNDLN